MSEQDVSSTEGGEKRRSEPRPLTDAETAKLAELDEQIGKFEAQKRWSDAIKAILQKAEIHQEPAKKVEFYAQAGAMYLEKSSNQAEAIKAYEAVLEHDARNVEALTRLKEMYEKRRDWEKLIHVMRLETELLDPDDRLLSYVEMAQLATERLRKPEVCIDLWKLVLAGDPDNPDALTNLATLYEKNREWAPLADVLEKQSERITDQTALVAALNKLGMIYGDKLSQDEGAVRAFRRLLAIDPNDRRAQEQIKKRLITMKSWGELEDFYAGTDKWDELIRTLERETENKEATAQEKIELFFRVARLWQTKKEKADRAAKAYEKVLELDPTNFDAAVALAPIYEGANDSKKLAGTYDVRLKHVTDPAERVVLLREAGLLHEEKLKDASTAFERFLEAFGLDPQQEVVREDVERVAKITNGWDRVVAQYENAIQGSADGDAIVSLRMSLGRVLAGVGRTDDAIAQYRAVYDAESDHRGAMEALEGLYRQTGKYRELKDIYARRAELETDPDVRKHIAYGNASLYEKELNSPDEAIDAYRAILTEYGDGEVEAYRALDRLYDQQQRWSDLAQAIERRIDLNPDDEQELAALKFRLARALEQHLGDKPRAVELYREILSLLPEHDGAREALEALLADPDLGGGAAEILEPIYEVRGDFEKLVRALEVLYTSAAEPEKKLELLSKIGETLQGRIGDAARAFDAYARALRDVPESEETLSRLEALGLELSRLEEVVTVVTELAASTSVPELRRRLYVRAAQLADASLGKVDAAVSAYTHVLTEDPGDVEVLGALEELYQRTERWKDLLGILRRRVELAGEPAAQEDLLARVAQIHVEKLADPAAAISTYQEILEIDPSSQRALAALDELFEQQQLWSELADNAARQLALADDETSKTRLMLRLADIRERRMGAVDAAVDIYRQILERDPTTPEAIAALERLVQTPEHQTVITEILEPLYREQNEFGKLISVHEIQLKNAGEADQRVDLLHKIAELYEVALDDLANAFGSHARALAEDPSNLTTQEQLERLSRATGNHEALARVYEERAPQVEDAQISASLYVKAAQVREEQLGDTATAIAHYQRVLELDASHLEAASALERLFHASERYEDLAQIYLVKARILEDAEEKKEYLFRAAAIYEELLERPVDAIAVYHQALEADAEDLRALDKLIELNLRLGQWAPLLEIYRKKAEIVTDPAEKKALLVEVGAVYERELGDSAKATDSYQRILEIDPDDVQALGRLDALYQAAGNWAELLSVLEHEAELASDPAEVISYRYRIGALYQHQLGDAARAVEGYREILEVIPDHEPTLNALEQMVSDGKEPLAAAGVLEPVYRAAGEWAKLIAVHEVQIRHEEDPVRRVELLHAVAELYETALDQQRQAFDAFARSLPLDSSSEATLTALERLAEPLGAWRDVTSLYDAEVAKLKAENAGDRLVEMAIRVAQLYEVQVQDVESAIARYNTVLEVEDTNATAITSLDRLYDATERWADLAKILEREVQTAASPDDVLQFQFRLGQVYQLALGDIDRAIAQYKEILAAAPEHAQALGALEELFAEGQKPLVVGEILEPLYRMQEAWDKLVGVQTVQLQYESVSEGRLAMMHRIAETAEERGGDHQVAFEWEQRALLESPRDERATAETDRLAEMLDAWKQLAGTLADVLEQPGRDAETRAFVGRRLAAIYEQREHDLTRAEETYRYVLGIDATDGESLEALDRIYTEHGAHEALAEVLRKRLAAAEKNGASKTDQVELAYRLGQVYEHDLLRPAEAIRTYTHVLDALDREHAESVHALADLYTREQQWPELFAAFERELAVAGGDSAKSDVYAKQARLADSRLGQQAKAIELWTKVLDLRGEDAEALNALGDIYAAQQKWNECVQVLEREVNIADEDATRIAIYSDIGRISWDKLQKERSALEAWERVLDLEPGNTGALLALAAIHRKAERSSELVDTLQRIIEVGAATLDDHSLEAVYVELGDLYERLLAQPMDAVDAYRHALDINAKNFATLDALERIHVAQAQWEDAIEIKEKRALALEDNDAKVAELLAIAKEWEEHAGDADKGTSAYQRVLELSPLHELAFDKLEHLHEEAGRWDDLIGMYVTRVEANEDAHPRVVLLRKAASVYEKHLNDKNNAFETLQVAWSEDFTDEETAREIERVAGLTQRWNELLTTANTALSEVTDTELKIAICLRCAKWYGTELKHPEYAIPYYQQILGLDPTNLPAMRQMADLYKQTAQWTTLAQVLGRLVEMTPDAAEKMAVYVQMGQLAGDQLGIPDQAMQYYQRALELDGSQLEALNALERIFRERKDWGDLLQVLKRKLDVLTDPVEQADERLKIAEVYEDRLADVDSAIESYRAVFEADAHNLAALKGLERLYTLKERWQELLQVLENQYEVVGTERERIAILTRLASMWEELFVKPDKAAERLEQVIEIDPNHEPSLRGLARMYRQLQKWDELVNTYERHVTATPDRTEKVGLYKAIGNVWAQEKNDVDRAIDAYLNVISIAEDDVEALDALSRLYDRRGDHGSSLDMMEQLSKRLTDPQALVDLRYRMGQLYDGKLGDRASAIDKYQSALDVEPGHLPSLEATRKIHVDNGDWLSAAKVLEQETQYQQNPRQVSKLLVELGDIYAQRLDEQDRAISVYEAAQKQDPDNEDAALPLAKHYVAESQWQQALPLLDLLVKRANKRPANEQHALWFDLGRTAAEVGDEEKALKAFTTANQLDPQHLPSLQGVAAAYYRAKDWEKAFKFYQMLLVHHRDALGKDDVTDTYFRLGVIKREQGERRKALNMFDKALEEDGHHRPTLDAVVALYAEQNEWEQVIHFKKQILDVATETEQFKLLDEIGDLWREKLKNTQKSIQSYVDASTLEPKNHVVLHKLLALYQEQKMADKMVEIIQRISDLDERTAAKSKYAYTIGVVQRDELKNLEEAVAKFDEALDLDPTQLKPFEAINKIHTTQKDWRQLERAFRKMLKRIVGKGNTDLEWNLWHNLGVIYRDRMQKIESAAEAFKMASNVKPDDLNGHQILAELYALVPTRIQDAIEEHQYLLRQDPFRVDSYRSLYKLYFDARAYDKAWCVASALSFLKKADAEQAQFYEQYKARGMIRPQSRLDNERWMKDLFHPDEDIYVGKIFEAITPALVAMKGQSDKALGLLKKQQVDPATSTVAFVKTFGFVAQVLALPMPRLFLQPDKPGTLAYGISVSDLPASVCGGSLLSGFTPQDLTFVVAKHLSYYRGEHYMRWILPTQNELKVAVVAAMRIVGMGPADPNIDASAQQIAQRLPPTNLEALRKVCKLFVDAGARTDVKKWVQAVELTGCRAGFLICNDLDIASRMIQSEPPSGPTDMPPKEKIKELVLFSVSEQYFRLREALGIQIQIG